MTDVNDDAHIPRVDIYWIDPKGQMRVSSLMPSHALDGEPVKDPYSKARITAQSWWEMPDTFRCAFPREVVMAQLRAVEDKATDTLWPGLGLLKGLAAMLRAVPDDQREYARDRDGKLQPFIPAERYDELRDNDRFLYNRGPKPEGLE